MFTIIQGRCLNGSDSHFDLNKMRVRRNLTGYEYTPECMRYKLRIINSTTVYNSMDNAFLPIALEKNLKINIE